MSLSESPIIHCVALTDQGQVRARNEDAVHADPRTGLIAVADGMGGHNAGDVASRLAIESLVAAIAASARLVDAVAAANLKIFAAAQSWPGCEGMGTTLSAARFTAEGTQLVVAHVGDSRVYRYRVGGELIRITRDHTTLQDVLDSGAYPPEQARRLVPRSYLTRALGIEAETTIDLHTLAVEEQDLYLLCTDGLTNLLSDEDIKSFLDRLHDGPLIDLARALIEAANARGGHDNVSVVLATLKNIRTPRVA